MLMNVKIVAHMNWIFYGIVSEKILDEIDNVIIGVTDVKRVFEIVRYC